MSRTPRANRATTRLGAMLALLPACGGQVVSGTAGLGDASAPTLDRRSLDASDASNAPEVSDVPTAFDALMAFDLPTAFDGPRDVAPDVPRRRDVVGQDVPAAEVTTRARPSCPDPSVRNCAVVRVRGGTFDMGPPEYPSVVQRGISVSGFVLDRHEVTAARFRAFYRAGMPLPPRTIAYPGGIVRMRGTVLEPTENPMPNVRDIHTWSREPGVSEEAPITLLTWATAQAFCVWDGGRLPTEAEWEWVAWNLPDGRPLPRTYPFGNAPYSCETAHINPDRCRSPGSTLPEPVGSRLPEGSFYDLSGSVAEWVADAAMSYSDPGCWGGRSQQDPVCGVLPDGGVLANAIRGMSAADSAPPTRVNRFSPEGPLDRVPVDYVSRIGMRCAYDE